MNMKELDINLEISYDIDEEDEREYFKRKYFPNNNIHINEREDVKTKLLTNVEVIDKCYTSIFYCKGENIFFCRLLKDMFGLKKDDYMLFAFADDKDFYTDEEDYEGCDEFWENINKIDDVTILLKNCLLNYGFDDSNSKIILKKYEVID